VLGTWLLPKLLKQVLAWGSRELFLVSVVAVGVGVGYALEKAGLSFALGAFVAGIILSESEFSHQALSDVVPLRDIFGLLFFVTVGMLFDPMYALSHAGKIVAVVVAIFLGKSIIFGALTRVFGYTNMAPWIVGLGLSHIGEFSFVLARSGLSGGLLSKDTYNLALTCTILTMAFAPLVSSAALPIGRALRRPGRTIQTIDLPKDELEGHVVVGGYGRSGRTVARALRAAGIPLLVVESDYALMRDITGAGLPAVWGDIAREEILRAAAISKARILVLTVPDRNTIQLTVERARHLNPGLLIIARASREHHVAELHKLGVEAAVQPEFEGGVEMVRQAFLHYDLDSEQVVHLLSGLRKQIYGESV
jgi:CPA2 family monovalent cation:H+ antiporter-2